MFTGIIEEIGRIKGVVRGSKSVRLDIAAKKVMEGTQVGDSIATNGVCLTVTALTGTGFTADVMPESVQRTSLGQLRAGSEVNLERALTLQTRLGGHIVSGHVDGTGTVIRREADENAVWIWVECPPALMRYIVEKGSVTLQGVSLTIAKMTPTSFAVSLIPHTQGATTLHSVCVGDVLNIENDVIAKYVEKFTMVPDDSADDSATAGSPTDSMEDKTALYRNFMMSR